MVSAKKLFLPPEEEVLEFKGLRVKEKVVTEKRVLFGVHSCDINALHILNKAYSFRYKDSYYLARRKNTLIIGVECQPSETCFCKSMDAFTVNKGYDLFLRKLNEEYYCVDIASKLGEKLTESPIFEDVDSALAREAKKRFFEKVKEKVPVKIEGLPEKMDICFADEKIWSDIAKRCLGCGNCTMVCPVCCCFNFVDTVDIDFKTGKRVRKWDACVLPNFSVVAGGINFRPTIQHRIRNWFYDKFKVFVDQVGVPGCVGCGRCVAYCPAKIDLREEIKKIWERFP
ncbi:MAG: 4Fe-4S dicluster domain-containing protein [Candidatus Bathyarchaeota archaeon]